MARCFSFFTLFHLSLTFFNRRFPLRLLGSRSTPFSLFSLKLIFEHFELESQLGISVTRVSDSFPMGFPLT